MKICSSCNKKKSLEEFYSDKRTSDGKYSSCKLCHKYYRGTTLSGLKNGEKPTPKGVANYHFNLISNRIRSAPFYRNTKCLFSFSEFEQFVIENWEQYTKLYKEWKKNHFAHRFAPSIDRIDPKGHYELGNIRFLSVYENVSRATKGIKQTAEMKAKRSKNLLKFYKSDVGRAMSLKRRTLTPEAVKDIRSSLKKGVTQKDLAKKYKTSTVTINSIALGRTYKF